MFHILSTDKPWERRECSSSGSQMAPLSCDPSVDEFGLYAQVQAPGNGVGDRRMFHFVDIHPTSKKIGSKDIDHSPIGSQFASRTARWMVVALGSAACFGEAAEGTQDEAVAIENSRSCLMDENPSDRDARDGTPARFVLRNAARRSGAKPDLRKNPKHDAQKPLLVKKLTEASSSEGRRVGCQSLQSRDSLQGIRRVEGGGSGGDPTTPWWV